MTKTRTILLTIATGLLLVGCNTIQGIGKDVESVGETVSDAAK